MRSSMQLTCLPSCCDNRVAFLAPANIVDSKNYKFILCVGCESTYIIKGGDGARNLDRQE